MDQTGSRDKSSLKGKKILVTGCAGFIGSSLCMKLLEEGFVVVGLDNMNDYYDVSLKNERLERFLSNPKFTFYKTDLADSDSVMNLFSAEQPDYVVNLAAQAGVRYSIDCPETYIQSNITGFFHILEACRRYPVEHLVYASSSSVYGGNEKTPFSESDQVDHPVSLYAATKKSNELMAYSYCKLYGIPATGLRFFTVYGPMGRPDMAYFKFANKIMNGEPIEIYNHGKMYRDFTYIDDVIGGLLHIIPSSPAEDLYGARYKIYNIGNHNPEKLMDMIEILEEKLGKKAEKIYLPIQPGDVYQTFADVSELMKDFDYKPDTRLETGLENFARWFLKWYEKEQV